MVARYKEEELQESWCRGRPLTQAKKRVYVSEEDYLKYSPELVSRWKRMYYVEEYKASVQLGKVIWRLLK